MGEDVPGSSAFENTVRTCSVLCESTNNMYMKAPLFCHTGFTRRDSQCHRAPSLPAHQAFPYGQRAANPSQQQCEEAPSGCDTAQAQAVWEGRRIQQKAGRERRGWAGRWQCRAGHRRHLPQGYSSLSSSELPTAPACPSAWGLIYCISGCATLHMVTFPPAVWINQLTELYSTTFP